ncbi:MAG: N-glycosylase/DNA lyase [Candidatus Omnitrophota bacterium]|jgi:N-glycosylase/DNA lyase
MEDLKKEYNKKKQKMKKRLKEFSQAWKKSDKKIFSELCFCICTPQSNAVYCDKAVADLEKSGVLYNGNRRQVRARLKAVRFPNNKSRFIIEARGLFTEKGRLKIKEKIDAGDIKGTRHWLARNVKGLGLKEASHFLRNIGLGKDLAILDVHVLKNMVKYRIIREAPKSISEKTYLALEEKIRKFAASKRIPMDELDLLFWSMETGEIFK